MASLLGPPAEGKPLSERTLEPIDPFGSKLGELMRRPVRNTETLPAPGRTEPHYIEPIPPVPGGQQVVDVRTLGPHAPRAPR